MELVREIPKLTYTNSYILLIVSLKFSLLFCSFSLFFPIVGSRMMVEGIIIALVCLILAVDYAPYETI